MVSDLVFTSHDRITTPTKPDSIALGDYNIDGHMVERVLLPDGTVSNEGCLSGWAKTQPKVPRKFEIPYRVMVPKATDATNLLVTCAVSSSHVGSGPLRLEPQYMNMGHAAGVAASLVALDPHLNATVQQVHVPGLQRLLAQQGVTYNMSGLPLHHD